jgi:hypothetical protein
MVAEFLFKENISLFYFYTIIKGKEASASFVVLNLVKIVHFLKLRVTLDRNHMLGLHWPITEQRSSDATTFSMLDPQSDAASET